MGIFVYPLSWLLRKNLELGNIFCRPSVCYRSFDDDLLSDHIRKLNEYGPEVYLRFLKRSFASLLRLRYALLMMFILHFDRRFTKTTLFGSILPCPCRGAPPE